VFFYIYGNNIECIAFVYFLIKTCPFTITRTDIKYCKDKNRVLIFSLHFSPHPLFQHFAACREYFSHRCEYKPLTRICVFALCLFSPSSSFAFWLSHFSRMFTSFVHFSTILFFPLCWWSARPIESDSLATTHVFLHVLCRVAFFALCDVFIFIA